MIRAAPSTESMRPARGMLNGTAQSRGEGPCGMPAKRPLTEDDRSPHSTVTFIAVVALAILAIWGAATYLVSLPLSLDEAVLLR